VVIFGKPEYFHHKLVQIGNLSDTISDSGVCVILYAAKLPGLTNNGVTELSLNNLVLDLGRKNQDGSLLKQMRAEITHLMHELSRKYSSVCVHDSQIIYPSIFHSSQDDSSECGDSSKQVSVSTDDSATSIWRLRRNKLTLNNPVLAQISCSVSDSPSQNGNYLEECEESSEEGVSVASGSHHFAG
jgi:hypothetical protein